MLTPFHTTYKAEDPGAGMKVGENPHAWLDPIEPVDADKMMEKVHKEMSRRGNTGGKHRKETA